MSTQIILKVLALRHRLRQRDRWTHQSSRSIRPVPRTYRKGMPALAVLRAWGASEEGEAFERSSRDDQH